MIDFDPSAIPSFDELLQHSWHLTERQQILLWRGKFEEQERRARIEEETFRRIKPLLALLKEYADAGGMGSAGENYFIIEELDKLVAELERS